MKLTKHSFILSSILLCLFFGHAVAEEGKIKAEDMVDVPVQPKAATLPPSRRAKLTEEQAVNQLKYMMVKGWARMEEELLGEGGFTPFGMILSPNGEFKPVYIAQEKKWKKELVLAALVENLKGIAKTRSMWAVGIMYVQSVKKDDGSYDDFIVVMTEHIAGWARHWSYPYKVVDGEVKLAAPTERAVKPVYFVE